MSGRGGRGHGRCGGHAGRGSGGGRGSAYSNGKEKTTKVGLCKDLKGNVFDFGTTLAADQMQITQEKIMQYIGAKYREDIANKLQNKTGSSCPPQHFQHDIDLPRAPNCACQESALMMKTAWLSSRTLLEAEIANNPTNHTLVTELAKLNNNISQGDFEAAQDVPVELTNQEWMDYSNECRKQSRRVAMLETHQGQAYSLILGQCMQLLQDKMKQDASWTTVSTSYDPLKLYKVIEQVVLKQTEDQYSFAVVHEQNLAVLNTKQGGLTNTQWYEHFDMQYDVTRSVGVEFGHKVLWEYFIQLAHSRSYY
jgi:hypothetical protein